MGDSYVFMRRLKDRLLLSVEHRAAPAIDDLRMELHTDGAALALRVVESDDDEEQTLHDRIVQLLKAEDRPWSQRKIREACEVRAATIAAVLADLVSEGLLIQGPAGYRIAP